MELVLNFNCLATSVSAECRLCIFLLHISHSTCAMGIPVIPAIEEFWMGRGEGWTHGWTDGSGPHCTFPIPVERQTDNLELMTHTKWGSGFPPSSTVDKPQGTSMPSPALISRQSSSVLFPLAVCAWQQVSDSSRWWDSQGRGKRASHALPCLRGSQA